LEKQTYGHRQETIERFFADAQEKRKMGLAPHRGLTAAAKWRTINPAAMYIKKGAIH
jgi:hypothetical protein